jgi:Bacterial regulatory helix-turn-helix protein, lysR family
MDRLASMQIFAHVVDSGSFATAATRLDTSPSVITHHVQLLEDRLGVQLLNRTTRRMNLTDVVECKQPLQPKSDEQVLERGRHLLPLDLEGIRPRISEFASTGHAMNNELSSVTSVNR